AHDDDACIFLDLIERAFPFRPVDAAFPAAGGIEVSVIEAISHDAQAPAKEFGETREQPGGFFPTTGEAGDVDPVFIKRVKLLRVVSRIERQGGADQTRATVARVV